MAEAITNKFAKDRGLAVRAISAGTVGGKKLNPMAVEALDEIGISLDGHSPKLLTQEMVNASKKVISMGCGVDAAACPAKFLLTEDWELDDPAGQPLEFVRTVRDAIVERVNRLLDEYETEKDQKY